MDIAVRDEAEEKLVRMTEEEDIGIHEFISRLILDEDRRRHVETMPLGKAERVKCHFPGCQETGLRRTVTDSGAHEI